MAAEYMLDAVSILGEGGNNAYYCQDHLHQAITLYAADAGDVWFTAEGSKVT